MDALPAQSSVGREADEVVLESDTMIMVQKQPMFGVFYNVLDASTMENVRRTVERLYWLGWFFPETVVKLARSASIAACTWIRKPAISIFAERPCASIIHGAGCVGAHTIHCTAWRHMVINVAQTFTTRCIPRIHCCAVSCLLVLEAHC